MNDLLKIQNIIHAKQFKDILMIITFLFYENEKN